MSRHRDCDEADEEFDELEQKFQALKADCDRARGLVLSGRYQDALACLDQMVYRPRWRSVDDCKQEYQRAIFKPPPPPPSGLWYYL